MYQYILFDLDGTLTDPKEGITKSVQYALHAFNIEEEADNLIDFIGPPLMDSFMKYYRMDEEEAARAIVKYRERFSTIGIFENGVYEGIPELLAYLKHIGKKIALATSKPEVYARRILERYELMQYFDVVVGSELDGRRTDKAEVIEEVLAQFGLESAENKQAVLMVGDRLHDMIGAEKNSVDSMGVYYGYAHEGELESAGAKYTVQTVEELRAFFQNGNKA